MSSSLTNGSRERAVPLAEILLFSAKASAALGSMSVGWWYAQVAAGKAPQPVIRRMRCTRWNADEVRAFWRDYVERGLDGEDQVLAVVNKASAALAAKRRASKQEREVRA